MKRLFWLGLGIAIGVYAQRRASEAARNLTPAGIGANLADGLRELGAGLGAFGAEVRAGMAARERELAELVERRTGTALPTYANALAEEPAHRPGRRARGAGA
ncbi:hypothetical protein SAMN05443637_10157 [Pseudonocardia thermophila]|jgi:hypothetical protein|uniref:Secreted protein n=1 Tax=Pseudonocardia thermophila TaxID=1848 RepID=A0A1M6N6C4_PSETH|nr:hypothetical protein [Pseudonocardia thermophila]SHJ91285.1 hypothetical protein SAMN05443637_10157 [Pseudonocardia thermophila]